MNIKKHAKKRYIERILGKTEIGEINSYLATNEKRIEDEINKLFLYSSFLFKGQINNHKTGNYYIKDNILLVVDAKDECLITICTISFPYPKEANTVLKNSLINEITNLRLEHQESIIEMNNNIDKEKDKIEEINTQIEILKTQLNILEKNKRLKKL